jgi:hypothetical protein
MGMKYVGLMLYLCSVKELKSEKTPKSTEETPSSNNGPELSFLRERNLQMQQQQAMAESAAAQVDEEDDDDEEEDLFNQEIPTSELDAIASVAGDDYDEEEYDEPDTYRQHQSDYYQTGQYNTSSVGRSGGHSRAPSTNVQNRMAPTTINYVSNSGQRF